MKLKRTAILIFIITSLFLILSCGKEKSIIIPQKSVELEETMSYLDTVVSKLEQVGENADSISLTVKFSVKKLPKGYDTLRFTLGGETFLSVNGIKASNSEGEIFDNFESYSIGRKNPDHSEIQYFTVKAHIGDLINTSFEIYGKINLLKTYPNSYYYTAFDIRGMDTHVIPLNHKRKKQVAVPLF